jgi:hypothetical protein
MHERKEDPRKHHGLDCTTLVCPRCGCESFYKAKPHETASNAVLPSTIANAKFLMVCTGEQYSSKIVDGADLHEEMAIACCGSLAAAGSVEVQENVEFLTDMDNWATDSDYGPYHIKQDIGETDHIEFWRLT